MIEDDDDEDQASPLPMKRDLNEPGAERSKEQYEMKERPPAYGDKENEEREPLVSGKSAKEKNKKDKKDKKKVEELYAKPDKSKKKAARDEDDESAAGETTPLYTNPVYKGKSQREDTVQLQDGTQADSWV